MCKDRGFDSSKKVELVSKFLQSKGYVQLPKLSRQYKIIFNEYKYEFKAYLNSLMKNLLDK